ncbi:winged helix-turn-helix transcriptional regulator [Nostoc sp. NIES-2111]
MRRYGQFCPIAKSAEIIGDPWSILIVRELLLGSSRFNALQRGLPRISPTVLNTRLKELEERGVIVRRRLNGQRGHAYHLTPAGRELSNVVEALAVWGMRWARDEMEPEDVDVSFLMFDVQRRIDRTALPDGETVVCFQFPDVINRQFRQWWVILGTDDVDLCYEDPGKDVDCYVTAPAGEMIKVWMGDIALASALRAGKVQLSGDRNLCRTFADWFALSAAAAVPRPTVDERKGRGPAGLG